jgi:hypothetical protein
MDNNNNNQQPVNFGNNNQQQPAFNFGNNNQQQPAFNFGNNNNNQQPAFNFGNNNQQPAFNFGIDIDIDNDNDIDDTNDKLPLPLNTDKVFIESLPIIKVMKLLDEIHLPIKHKYVGIEDLKNFIEKTEILLKLDIESMDYLLTNKLPSLDIIFPAIEHLNLFLSDADIGAIALVSTNLHNLMVSNFGKLKIDICVAKHYRGV